MKQAFLELVIFSFDCFNLITFPFSNETFLIAGN